MSVILNPASERNPASEGGFINNAAYSNNPFLPSCQGVGVL